MNLPPPLYPTRKREIHVIPTRDTTMHITGATCACRPSLQTGNPATAAPVYMHHAYDRRELDELRGRAPLPSATATSATPTHKPWEVIEVFT